MISCKVPPRLRPDARPEDLSNTAIEIVAGSSRGSADNHVLTELMRALTNAYLDLSAKQQAGGYGLRGGGHFIGLRDFYNFVKLLDRKIRRDRTAATNTGRLSGALLIECILRSFGGFRAADIVHIVAESFWSHCKRVLSVDAVCAGSVELPPLLSI